MWRSPGRESWKNLLTVSAMTQNAHDDTFDSETPCPECHVIICAYYCQGLDPDCPAKEKLHAIECSY